MGFLDRLAALFGLKKKEAHVLCIGLDNSGKTTIINRLKPEKVRTSRLRPSASQHTHSPSASSHGHRTDNRFQRREIRHVEVNGSFLLHATITVYLASSLRCLICLVRGVIEIFGNTITSRCRCEFYEESMLILALLFRDAQAIIFVIDSSDKLRLVVAKDELNLLLGHDSKKRAFTDRGITLSFFI